MSFSHIMISYAYSGYDFFKKMYPGTEDEYKKLLTGIFHIWRLLFVFFGIIPLITLIIMNQNSNMLIWHKKLLETWQEKLGLSNYLVAWISYLKGLIFGLLIYHFFIK